jgi:hypothetical protein
MHSPVVLLRKQVERQFRPVEGCDGPAPGLHRITTVVGMVEVTIREVARLGVTGLRGARLEGA